MRSLEAELKHAQNEANHIGMQNSKILKAGNPLEKTDFLDKQRKELAECKQKITQLSADLVSMK